MRQYKPTYKCGALPYGVMNSFNQLLYASLISFEGVRLLDPAGQIHFSPRSKEEIRHCWMHDVVGSLLDLSRFPTAYKG